MAALPNASCRTALSLPDEHSEIAVLQLMQPASPAGGLATRSWRGRIKPIGGVRKKCAGGTRQYGSGQIVGDRG
jgi:hypothetical protein